MGRVHFGSLILGALLYWLVTKFLLKRNATA